jgi:hypothetical protein
MKFRGGNSRRTETNVVEANIVGGVTFVLSYLFLAQVLSIDHSGWGKMAILGLLVFGTFVFWLVALYLLAVLIRMLRAIDLLSTVPDSRAQVLFVAVLTTIFAISLLQARSWASALGAIWVAAVVLNYGAAAVLAEMNGDRPVV